MKKSPLVIVAPMCTATGMITGDYLSQGYYRLLKPSNAPRMYRYSGYVTVTIIQITIQTITTTTITTTTTTP